MFKISIFHAWQIFFQLFKLSFKILNENVNDIKQAQLELESKFDQAMANPNTGADLNNITKNLKAATHSLNRAFKQNPLGGDIFEKIESDRLFLENALTNLIGEAERNSFDSLKNTIFVEKNNKIEFQNIIKRYFVIPSFVFSFFSSHIWILNSNNREEDSKQTIKDLQASLTDIKLEKEVEIQKRNELIAHLKDRLQELKAKTNMEAKYVKKSTDNSVAQTKKKCDLSELELKQQIEVFGFFQINLKTRKTKFLLKEIDWANRRRKPLQCWAGIILEVINSRMKFLLFWLHNPIINSFFFKKMKQLTDQWSEKSDKETLQKQVDLDNLKAIRTKDLERYQHLAKLVRLILFSFFYILDLF